MLNEMEANHHSECTEKATDAMRDSANAELAAAAGVVRTAALLEYGHYYYILLLLLEYGHYYYMLLLSLEHRHSRLG